MSDGVIVEVAGFSLDYSLWGLPGPCMLGHYTLSPKPRSLDLTLDSEITKQWPVNALPVWCSALQV